MSEIDDVLRAEAEELGLKVHGNMKPETLQARIDAARAENEAEETDEEPEATADEPVAEDAAPEDDGWPQQIAPLAWLDQQGRRYTDLGEALAGAQECRETAK